MTESDRVVELACLRVERGRIVDRIVTLVDPGIAIPPSAPAIHGIVDEDVVGAPRLESLISRVEALARGATVVAHNARFDLAFLPFLANRPVICTLQLARRLIDAPIHRIDFLREHLGLDVECVAVTAHRAESDARVTAVLVDRLFAHVLERRRERTIDAVIDFLATPVLLDGFAFGSYRGVPLRDVPSSYLLEIVSEGFAGWPDVRHSAAWELARRAAADAGRTVGEANAVHAIRAPSSGCAAAPSGGHASL